MCERLLLDITHFFKLFINLGLTNSHLSISFLHLSYNFYGSFIIWNLMNTFETSWIPLINKLINIHKHKYQSNKICAVIVILIVFSSCDHNNYIVIVTRLFNFATFFFTLVTYNIGNLIISRNYFSKNYLN